MYSHTPILGGDKVKLPNEVQWGSRMGQQDGAAGWVGKQEMGSTAAVLLWGLLLRHQEW